MMTPIYGITERKKAELDALTLQVLDAQHEVEQFQSIVNSLTTKTTNFQGFLTTAENNKTQAYNNKALIDQMVSSALDLQNKSKTALKEAIRANNKAKVLSESMRQIIDKLIYTADLLNKLANTILRQKSLNPLVSDELVSMVGTAGADANNAVALTLVALKATFAAEASNLESEAALALEDYQSAIFYEMLVKTVVNKSEKEPVKSLKDIFYEAYVNAKADYKRADKAFKITNNQLIGARSALDEAQIKLKSLQLGLGAANAAALAS